MGGVECEVRFILTAISKRSCGVSSSREDCDKRVKLSYVKGWNDQVALPVKEIGSHLEFMISG